MRELDFDIKNSYFMIVSFLILLSHQDLMQIFYGITVKNMTILFIFSFYGLLEGLNNVPELRRRIVDDKCLEYKN
jgi:hypothetical protein